MKYVSIDLETTGLNPATCNVIEFAAVVDDLKNPKPVNDLPFCRFYLLPPDHSTYSGEPTALAWHSEIFKKIANPKSHNIPVIPLEGLGWAFRHFLSSEGFTGRVNVAGKNFSSFDVDFLKEIPEFQKHVGLDRYETNKNGIYLARRVIDPALFYWMPESDDALPDTKTCLSRAGIDVGSRHDALEDARIVVELVREAVLPLKK